MHTSVNNQIEINYQQKCLLHFTFRLLNIYFAKVFCFRKSLVTVHTVAEFAHGFIPVLMYLVS